MNFRILTVLAPLAVAACGPSPTIGLLEDHVEHDIRSNFVVCSNYQCTARYNVALTDAEWRQVRAFFDPPATDAAAERRQIALAIGQIERIVGPKTGTTGDRPGAAILTTRTRGQMDCLDESHNTTVYLHLLERNRLLTWHKVGQPIIRGHVIDRWFHNTATVTDTATGIQWVIDSWFGANGEPADVVTADVWLDGWEPEKYKSRTDR
ncbi:hypothetical protein [Emcibacter sp. SYSU 3D8]|uniref:hypothetical protein n=1 Tax=Emcibacter sp. SYSU 3D8 TaxID=3133969 RepID=UPI0031FE78AB